MSRRGIDGARVARMRRVMAGFTTRGEVCGLVWVLARSGDVEVAAAGTMDEDGREPVGEDTIFRISSMTKPVSAVGALILVEECRLRLDDPLDDLLPELAHRRVLARPGGSLEDTVPANRPITLRDVLTFRLGLGMDFTDVRPRSRTCAD